MGRMHDIPYPIPDDVLERVGARLDADPLSDDAARTLYETLNRIDLPYIDESRVVSVPPLPLPAQPPPHLDPDFWNKVNATQALRFGMTG